MNYKSVRMRPSPAWIRVRTESGMNQCDRRVIIRILQIREEQTKLIYQEHSFISDSTAGKGCHINDRVKTKALPDTRPHIQIRKCHICIICTLLKYTSYNVKLTVKINTLFYFLWPFNKSLHNARHTFNCSASKYICLYRNFSPSKEIHSFFFDDHFEYLLCLISRKLVLWEEEHTNS